MQRIKSFVKTTFLGGIVVILPVTIIAAVFRWLYVKATDTIQPLTNMVMAKSELREYIADVVVIGGIVLSCFLVGLLVRTGVGRFVHRHLESKILGFAPGYTLVKETVLQFLGRRKSPFSSVALARIFGNETMVTAFVTDEHPDGSFTVFVPTGPNPTSGQIFHLGRQYVHPIDVGVDETMRSIISCGAGSQSLLHKFRAEHAID